MSVWSEQTVRLNLDLGDRRLWGIPLRLKVRQIWLSDRQEAQASPQAPRETLPKGFRGFLVRSLPLSHHQPQLSWAAGYLCYVRQQYQRCYIDLSMGFEPYEAKFSSKTRSTLRRKIKRIADENGGELIWRKYTTPQSLTEFFEYASQISRRTYQHRLFDAGLPETDEFREHATELARHDMVRAYILFHAKEPAAYLFCPVRDNALIYEFLGYDPRFMNLSAGTVLQWVALRDLFAENRFALFDFTSGESEHKRFFSTGQLLCGDVYFLRPTPGVCLILVTQILVDKFSRSLGRVLDRLGLKTRVKQILRFGFARRGSTP